MWFWIFAAWFIGFGVSWRICSTYIVDDVHKDRLDVARVLGKIDHKTL